MSSQPSTIGQLACWTHDAVERIKHKLKEAMPEAQYKALMLAMQDVLAADSMFRIVSR